MFTVAHLSDPHLSPLPQPPVAALLGKRALGYLSWKLRRRMIHSQSVIAALQADLADAHADHIVVTGDITNIALPEEFVRAAQWLRTLGDPGRVSIVPGNHDAYARVAWSQSLARWSAFMSPDDTAGPSCASSFPFVRERGPVAIIGLSTAHPTPPFFASGSLGRLQLDALDTELLRLGERGLFRIVLIHHPPMDHATHPRKRLTDARAFRNVIAQRGAELVLHGHTHRSHATELAGPKRAAAVLGVTSASANRLKADGRHARYHLYRIGRDRESWNVEVEVRQLAEDGDGFVTENRFRLALPG